MAMLTGGQLVAKMLKKENVKHVFTLSGLHIAPIYVGCVEEGIQIIDTRHEQAAAHAADAYARLTRGIGVAIVTAGPGVTDALTGVANAFFANSPMILIGGAAHIANQTRGSLQEMPQLELFKTITKWSDRVPRPDLIPSYFAKAFRTATQYRPSLRRSGSVPPTSRTTGTVPDLDRSSRNDRRCSSSCSRRGFRSAASRCH